MHGTEHRGGGVSFSHELPGQISVCAKYPPDKVTVLRGSVYVSGVQAERKLSHLRGTVGDVHGQLHHDIGSAGIYQFAISFCVCVYIYVVVYIYTNLPLVTSSFFFLLHSLC